MTRSLAVSVLIHAVLIFVLVSLDTGQVPARAPSEYQQKVAGKESKIVWYKFRKELPDVSPSGKSSTSKRMDELPLRAEMKAPQSIVSSPVDAPKRTQMVWMPAPQIAPQPLVPSPNLIAIKLPDMPVPRPKAFVQPAPPPPPSLASAQLAPAAPLLETQQARPAQLPSFRLPPKPYVAPPPMARPPLARANPLSDAPELKAGPVLSANAVPQLAPKLPARPFTPPVNGPGVNHSKTVAVDAPPPPDLQANSRDLNIAIVGLNPLDTHAPPPAASSPAAFSAGPDPRATGATSEPAAHGLSVPDLFIHSPGKTKSDLIAEAYASPTSQGNLRAAMRGRQPTIVEPTITPDKDLAASSQPGAAKLTSAPDPRFNGRDVYLMAIQMPNLTSYSGSWLMWYADRTAREAGLAPIAAPVPHRKVDPKYIATAAEERIEGRVQLACVIDRQGNVSAVELVRGLDDRLNQSAREALAKWQFYPALRNGQPIDVDVLVDIPFRLAPKAGGRR